MSNCGYLYSVHALITYVANFILKQWRKKKRQILEIVASFYDIDKAIVPRLQSPCPSFNKGFMFIKLWDLNT